MEKNTLKKVALVSAITAGGIATGFGIAKIRDKKKKAVIEEYLDNIGPEYEEEEKAKQKKKKKSGIIPWPDM